MATAIKGSITSTNPDGIVRQPGGTLSYKNDGTIEGQYVFEGDVAYLGNRPKTGDKHPYDAKAECYNVELVFMGLKKFQARCSYFGLTSSKTDAIISYTPGTNQEPITAHPDFTEKLAGVPGDAKNGALWINSSDGTTITEILPEDTDKQVEFVGFVKPAIKELFGVEFYLAASCMVSRSYWTSEVPKLENIMKIVSSIPGFKAPKNVKDFLLTDTPYRQVGSFYQVTEQYMGSGINGWSKLLYPVT